MEKKKDIFYIYNGLEEDVKNLKEKVITNLKNELKNIGFRLVAEWVDWGLPIIYNDIFLVEYKQILFSVKMSAGNKQIFIGHLIFTRFDTIDMNKLSRESCKSLFGYKIKNNIIQNISGKSFEQKNKSLVYRDLLRIEKIKKLLEEN